jgi:hypothetical protein
MGMADLDPTLRDVVLSSSLLSPRDVMLDDDDDESDDDEWKSLSPSDDDDISSNDKEGDERIPVRCSFLASLPWFLPSLPSSFL